MTTAAQAKRIVALDDALQGLKGLAQVMKNRAPARGHERVMLAIQVQDQCASGADIRADISLDLETADLLLPMIRRLIREQLHALGAKP